MRALVQRVTRASVAVAGARVGEIGAGLLIFVGVGHGDTQAHAEQLARKLAKLRVFSDARGKMNLSLLETGGAALVVSQFTLYADTSRGNRPSYTGAAPPAQAEALYRHFAAQLSAQGVPVATGVFAADMQVSLVNDGPVTLWVVV